MFAKSQVPGVVSAKNAWVVLAEFLFQGVLETPIGLSTEQYLDIAWLGIHNNQSQMFKKTKNTCGAGAFQIIRSPGYNF